MELVCEDLKKNWEILLENCKGPYLDEYLELKKQLSLF
jgi:hypothetical protein